MLSVIIIMILKIFMFLFLTLRSNEDAFNFLETEIIVMELLLFFIIMIIMDQPCWSCCWWWWINNIFENFSGKLGNKEINDWSSLLGGITTPSALYDRYPIILLNHAANIELRILAKNSIEYDVILNSHEMRIKLFCLQIIGIALIIR